MCASPAKRNRRALARRQRGFTLPEALLAIVVLGVGMAGVMLAFGAVARHSADPVLRKQMMGIAQELLEEIALKPYAAAANSAPAGCARDTYNDIADYHGYSSTGVCTIDGVVIPALASYNISASVVAGTLAGVNAARQITVSVSHGGDSLTLKTWRTDYAAP